MNYYFENSLVGKAIFAMDLEGVNYGGGHLMTGVDTMINKPFEILFTYNGGVNAFPR